MKYLKELWTIKNHYLDKLRMLGNPNFDKEDEIFFGVTLQDKSKFEEHVYALEYLLDSRYKVSMSEDTLYRPDSTKFERVFKEYLSHIEGLQDTSYLHRVEPLLGRELTKVIKRERDTCEYYLEKIKDTEYIDQLPEVLKPVRRNEYLNKHNTTIKGKGILKF